jgi:uncharacterized protein (TIGR02996 family)
MSGTLTEGDMLLRDICLHPDDPVPRLIYADWLEDEAGQQERARIIRAEIERNGVIHCTRIGASLRRDEARTKLWWSRKLEDEVVRHLLGNALYHLAIQGQEIDWLAIHRGFVHTVGLPMDLFIRRAGAIFGSHPITRVDITDREPRNAFGWTQGRAPPDMAASSYHIPDEIPLWKRGGEMTEMTSGAHVVKVWTYEPQAIPSKSARQVAKDALSAACVEYGRQQRGWGEGGEDDDRPAD